MAANDYYKRSSNSQYGTPYGRSDPPKLPALPISHYSSLNDHHADSPLSPVFDSTPLYDSSSRINDSREFYSGGRTEQPRASRQYSDEIPLRENPQPFAGNKDASESRIPLQPTPPEAPAEHQRRRRRREPEKKGWFSGRITWVVYILSVIQASVFIAELVKNGMLTLNRINLANAMRSSSDIYAHPNSTSNKSNDWSFVLCTDKHGRPLYSLHEGYFRSRLAAKY
jgi:hypothetical protein